MKRKNTATAYINGTVYTVTGDSWDKAPQEAIVASSDGRIAFVGSTKAALSFAEEFGSEKTVIVDLDGKVVFPGFIDTHVHLPGLSVTQLYEIDLYGTRLKEETLKKIREYVLQHPDKDVYFGHGFNMGISGDSRGPRKEWLDEIVDDKPMVLTSHDGHSVWMNSKAFEVFDICENCEVPTGGCIKVDEVTGAPIGTVSDCFDMLINHPTLTDEEQRATIGHFQNQMLGWGFTAAMLIAPNFVDIDHLKDFEDAGDLVMRFNLSEMVGDKSEFGDAIKRIDRLNGLFECSDRVKAKTLKYFADGVVEGLTAYLFEPYLGFENNACGLCQGYRSELLWDEDELAECFTETVKRGLQIHVHSIGDAATAATVLAMRKAQEKNPDEDPRNVLTHIQLLRAEEIKSMAELGIIAANQPFWHAKEPDWYVCVEEFTLGEERAASAYPLKSCLDAGVKLTFSGDFPVAHVNNPFAAIETSVTRNLADEETYCVSKLADMDDPRWLRNPNERIPLKAAIEAYTINGAYQLFREDEIGSIEVGKKADFIVVNRDPFYVNPIDISDISVLRTVIDGETVVDKSGH